MTSFDERAATWDDDPAKVERARVVAPLLELVRSLSARRSERQVRALRWSGDLDGVIAFLRHCWSGGYALPAVDQP